MEASPVLPFLLSSVAGEGEGQPRQVLSLCSWLSAKPDEKQQDPQRPGGDHSSPSLPARSAEQEEKESDRGGLVGLVLCGQLLESQWQDARKGL